MQLHEPKIYVVVTDSRDSKIFGVMYRDYKALSFTYFRTLIKVTTFIGHMSYVSEVLC